MKPTITAADLFCGAGGTSTGLLQAARQLGLPVKLYALNHWQVAITTHAANHPDVRHLWADIEGINPREVVPGGRLRLLVASPECIYHSRARGGKPINDQRRCSANYVIDWARELDIEDLLIENVPEFVDWGPVYPDDYPVKKLQNQPIPERRGEEFRRFVGDLQALGYRTEHRVLRAADYGDPTTRERFFLRARKGGGAITWPALTHRREEWRAAREIIDWSQPGRSIYGRKTPLVPATMKRILAGVRKFSGLAPFLVEYHGDHPGTRSSERRHRSIDEPLPTQDTSNRFGLAQPFLMNITHSQSLTGYTYSVEEPMRTIVAQEEFGLVQPCLTVLRNHADGLPIDGPLPTICAEGQHLGISVPVPYLVNMKGRSTAADIDLPLPTQTAHAQHLAFAQPFLTEYYGTGSAQSVELPLNTVTTKDRFGLAQPALLACGGGESYLIEAMHAADTLYRPLLVDLDGVLYLVDILYRMLSPRELAAAMSFPADYWFSGNQSDQVRQIGNSVPVGTATALCRSILEGSCHLCLN